MSGRDGRGRSAELAEGVLPGSVDVTICEHELVLHPGRRLRHRTSSLTAAGTDVMVDSCLVVPCAERVRDVGIERQILRWRERLRSISSFGYAVLEPMPFGGLLVRERALELIQSDVIPPVEYVRIKRAKLRVEFA